MSFFNAIVGPFRGKPWRARPGDTGLDLDGAERIVRGPKSGQDFFPQRTINLMPLSGFLPCFNLQTVETARGRTPVFVPLTRAVKVFDFLQPKNQR